MKIAIDDIKATPKRLAYAEAVEELNSQLARGVRDYRLPADLGVDLEYYRAGLDVFFRGALRGDVVGSCARCLEDYVFTLDKPFLFVLTPRAAAVDPVAPSAEDMERSTYEGDEIDLAPLVHEQVLLALPTRPLCTEGCRGLCARCGANLNAGPCDCPAASPDPRLAVLHALVRGK
jgi:uncharacterized protein